MNWDAIVVGSGASGLTAAIRAARGGLKVVVLEKASEFGGTTAVSGGGVWIPANHLAAAAGIPDSTPIARKYILDVIGQSAKSELIDAYLDTGPEMIRWLHDNTAVEFLISLPSSDWYPEIPGAVTTGRLLSPKEYNGLELGEHFKHVRAPRQEFNAPGGMMIDLFDLPYLATLPQPRSIWHMAKIAGRFGIDKMMHGKGARLTMGNALVGRLLKSALDAGVTLRRGITVSELILENDRVVGVKAKAEDAVEELRARLGVVLASGGFSANEQLRKAYIPYAEHHVSILPYENTGDGLNMALDSGAALDDDNLQNGVWSVVSKMKRADGYVARYAHLVDMSKPGCIAVNAKGERFGNEASVHFVEDMHSSGSVPAHLVADAAFVKKYGFGLALPGANLKPLIEAGYLIQAQGIRELAAAIGVDQDGLTTAVAKMNSYAVTGLDVDFHKGDSEINREFGDHKHGPNPCLGPVATPPFYAIKIYPGDGSTTVGLKIDVDCRVLNAHSEAIPGLYAAGLDANSIWRGKSPAHGCNVGPAMVQGYITAKSLIAAQPAA